MAGNKTERICCVCRTKKPIGELLRIARVDGEFKIDLNHNLNGRGAHICKNRECIEKCIKTRALNRSFKTQVSNEVYEKLPK